MQMTLCKIVLKSKYWLQNIKYLYHIILIKLDTNQNLFLKYYQPKRGLSICRCTSVWLKSRFGTLSYRGPLPI